MTLAPRQQALASLESCLSNIGPQLKASDPKRYAAAEALRAGLRTGAAVGAEPMRVAKELARWSLEQQRAVFARQLAAVGARGLPGTPLAAQALVAAIRLLDGALEATRGKTPGRDTVARLKRAAADVERLARPRSQALTPFKVRAGVIASRSF